jgi:SAM-dependent methyltransferase
MPDDRLEVLEKHLEKCRSGGTDPTTRIIWQSLGDIIAKTASVYCSKGDYVLDVGCGGAGLLVSLSKQGANCYGIDPLREVSLLRANENVTKDNAKVHLGQAVGENLPFKDSSFQMVLLLSTIQHVNDQEKVLSEIWRVLKTNGILIATVPTSKNISTLFRESKKPEHFTRNFNLAQFKKILTDSGFSIVRIRGGSFLPPLAFKALVVSRYLFRDKVARKLVDCSNFFAEAMPPAATSILAVCRKAE